MNIKLRQHQQEAMNLALKSFADGLHKISISMTTGSGKTITALSIADNFIKDNGNAAVLYLSRYRLSVEQIKHRLREQEMQYSIATSMKNYYKESFLITTYQDLLDNYTKVSLLNFALVICDDADTMKSPLYNKIFSIKNSCFLGLVQNSNMDEKCWFYDSKTIFEYSDAIYINRFYNENIVINEFIAPLLDKCRFEKIRTNEFFDFSQYKAKPDIIAEINGEQVVFEVKIYRGIKNEAQIINSAVQHIQTIKRSALLDKYIKRHYGIIMFCDINENLKRELIKKNNVFIWDIKNLLHICNGDEELINILSKLVPYPINDINPVEPFGAFVNIFANNNSNTKSFPVLSKGEELIDRLNNCNTGKSNKNAILYEDICNDIIKYLFGNEFSQFSTQHKTKDNMFRMDLLCSLKGTTEFWRFIIQFFNTKFVVFEYKNYTNKVEQNLIYVTEKYLFSAALRNIAFIISRKGFDENAHKAALGVLKETRKFIVDITDKDLIEMIKMKEKGEEPSDYLLDKVENLLMSVSK